MSCGGEASPSVSWLRRFRFGLTAGFTTADLAVFDSATGAEAFGYIERQATTAFVELRATDRISVSLGGGALARGRLELHWPAGVAVRRESFELLPGGLATAALSIQAVAESRRVPFVLVGASVGVGVGDAVERTTGAREGLVAIDARGFVTVGKTFAERLRPYASIRAFGGPLFVGSRATGTDRYHLQGAVGLAVVLPRGFDVFAEVAPGPERAGSVGLGFRPGY